MSDSTTVPEFVRRIVDEYVALYDEIDGGDRKEADLVPRIVDHLFINALGFTRADYEQENNWNDVRFYDDERNPAIILEAKRRDRDAEDGIDQAFRYASDTPYVRYLIATNLDRMLIYERCGADESTAETRHDVSARLLADIPFQGIVNTASGSRSSLSSTLSLDEIQEIQQLTVLQRREIHDADRYDEFAFNDRQDVSTDVGFDNLLDSLGTCLDEYFMPYTLSAFDLFSERHHQFESEEDDLESQIEQLRKEGHDDTEIAELETQLVELRDEFDPYRQFWSNYQTWIRLSNRTENDPEENKRVFCRESVYVQLNKILLIRIAEDKDLINRMISNGGVTDYFDFWNDYTRYTSRDYADLFDLACEELSEVYESLYTQQIFDWELQANHGLDQVIQRTFWHLNHYEFTDVNRDVLGHLYEEHLPPDERKELGEFYTPTAVVDLILDRVGYTSNEYLEGQEFDLLDPACGSGTFLVRAASRLLERLDQKGVQPREAIEIVQERLHGFDINPFACHIAEMNLLFQVVDLYREVKAQDPDYTLDRFRIYQTDSLRRETQISLTGMGSDALQRKYQQERREADDMKSRNNYRFVVGNPPYVRIQNIAEGPAKEDYGKYRTAHYNYDLYVLFVEKAASWLAEGGELGYIISNKFVQSRYGEKLRVFVPQNYRVRDVVNFGDVDVFESAKSFPVIFVAERINKSERERAAEEFELPAYEFTYAKVTDTLPDLVEAGAIGGWDAGRNGARPSVLNGGDDDRKMQEINQYRTTELIAQYLPASTEEEIPTVDSSELLESIRIECELDYDLEARPPVESFAVTSGMIAGGEWRFLPREEEQALAALERGGQNLATYCRGQKVERGLRTGANDVFVVNGETIEEYEIESEVIQPLLEAEHVKRWETLWEDNYILYATRETDLSEYPNAREYLNAHREELEDRYCVSKGNSSWFELDNSKNSTLFERGKIVTPDLCLYSNFSYVIEESFYCLDNTYYILPEALDEQYLVGILNSDAVQFFLRRTAPTYKDDYLRYKSEYLAEIPVPDPSSTRPQAVETVAEIAGKLQETAKEFREAKAIIEQPSQLLNTRPNESGIPTTSFSRVGYVEQLSFRSDEEVENQLQTETDGPTVHFTSDDSLTFTDESITKSFIKLLEILSIETVGEVIDLPVPETEDALSNVLDQYARSKQTLREAESQMADLETELDQTVYRLYDLDEETISLIGDRVKRPRNPLDSKAMK